MKQSSSARQLGSDLDSFTWSSPAISSPTARRKRSSGNNNRKTLQRDASAPVLSSTAGQMGGGKHTTNVRTVQENNFMSARSASASSLQVPATPLDTGFGTKSASKDDSDHNAANTIDHGASVSLPPKVYVPHNTRPGWTPRAVVVRRLQHSYSSMPLQNILDERSDINTNQLYNELLKNTTGTEDIVRPDQKEQEKQEDQDATNNSTSAEFEFGSMLGTNLIKMLPITMFDDSEFESYPLETWVSHRATGRALRGKTWSKCTAIQMDSDHERLHIEWHADQTKAVVHRLGICFDAENPVAFVDRLEHCVKQRQIAESCIRYNLYVDCMPAEELGGLDAEQGNATTKNEWCWFCVVFLLVLCWCGV